MPLTGDALAAQQVQDRLKALTQLVHEIEAKRQQSEHELNALQKFQASHEEKEKQNYQGKLKSLYKSAIQQTEQEEDVLRKALQKIAEIRNIKNERKIQARLSGNKESLRKGTWMKMLQVSAQTLPLFVSKNGEKPPPLCGAIPADPSYHAKIGDMVAALVEVSDEEGKEDWILAEVSSYNQFTKKYEVDDFLKERNQKERHILSKSCVVPLPLMRANPETDPDALFAPGTSIYALFPQTTTLYKGVVYKQPATHTDEYEILFEDSTYSDGYSPPLFAAQRYVIQCNDNFASKSK